jgi:hypothetical protein
VIGTEGSSGATIDVRESRLRVLATCAATTIAGWDLFAASQISAFRGWHAFAWTAGTFWGAFMCAVLVARALGRQRNKGPWLFALAYSINLPLIFVVRAEGVRSPAATLIGEHSSSYLPLAIGSIGVLGVLAMVGYRLEPKQLFSDRRSKD